MYDLSTKFKKFYENDVVLPKKETDNLRSKKQLNIDRLKAGIEEYNTENGTAYRVAEIIEQGSVAMSTVTQNESNDYDIDVAIVFDDSNVNGLTQTTVKNMVVKALKKKCTNFKTEPEALTNCVRIVYSDNYHIDFAIYRRTKNDDGSYKYEHAGSQWRERDPRAINKWFKDEIIEHGERLRQAVRLSKMFCKSRSHWQMPGGLIQSVLCDEKIQNYERIDEMFYYTIKQVCNRLSWSKEVINPTNEQSLLLKPKDETKVTNLYNRLNNYLDKLNILFSDECTESDAIGAWYDFFNHDYWTYEESKNRVVANNNSTTVTSYNKDISYCDDTEEFIENIMPVNYVSYYKVCLNCKILREGKIYSDLRAILLRGERIKIGDSLYFYIDENKSVLFGSYNIFLKVKNVGLYAEINNNIRGEIFNIKKYKLINEKYHYEEAAFSGEHFVECYIEQNGVCVAYDFLRVPIE